MQRVLTSLGVGLFMLAILVPMDHFHFFPNSLIRDGVVAAICGLIVTFAIPRVLPKTQASPKAKTS